ncbi:MAG: hypothetical protein HKM95_00510, partial [Inquilinus sp.]|nr:hypothetical protein [Inquilinus sp.]
MTVTRTVAAIVVAGLAALAAIGDAVAQAGRVPYAFAYIGLDSDPLYRPGRAYTGLTLRDANRPLDGAAMALRESRIVGRSLGLSLELIEAMVDDVSDVVAAMES